MPITVIDREYILHRGECPCGEVSFIMPGPDRALEQTTASPGLIAKVITDKFDYHVPVYRQERILADHGVQIQRSVLNGWILRSATVFQPIISRMWEMARLMAHRQCDETPICVVKDKKSKKYFFWCLLSEKIAVFRATEKRNRQEASQTLGDKASKTVTDGHGVYNKNTVKGEHAGCWSHARRKFYISLLSFPAEAWAFLIVISGLFMVEREAQKSGFPPEQRLQLRKQKSVVLLNELAVLMACHNPPPKSSLGIAINYVNKRWTELTVFLKDGKIPIHNNAVEQIFRNVKLGFKNFLFCKSDLGIEAVCGFYSLITTCKLNDVDPSAYIADVLVKINGGWPKNRLDELLPWNWKKAGGKIFPQNATVKDQFLPAEDVIHNRKLTKKVLLKLCRKQFEYNQPSPVGNAPPI